MALRIISALSSMRFSSQQIGLPTSAQSTFERLSSGQRVTDRPSDVAISSLLRRDMRIATAALTNASAGIAITSVAGGAMKEISALLGRMYELAERSAGQTMLSNEERSALQGEFSAVASKIQGIANSTSYNGIKLLSAGSNVVLQVGLDASKSSELSFSVGGGTLEELGLANESTNAQLYSISDSAAADTAMGQVARAMEEIKTQRSAFTSMEDRLQVSIANLSSAREGIAAAENSLREAASFEASAEKTRSQIVQDAGAALLAQANQQPLSAAQLLQGAALDESSGTAASSAIAPTNALSESRPLQKNEKTAEAVRRDLKGR